MRVLHIVPVLDPTNSYGGPISVALEQCKQLAQRGHQVQILAGWHGDGEPPTELEDVKCHTFPLRTLIPGPRFAGMVAPSMFKWLSSSRPSFDLAHIHFSRDLNQLLTAGILALKKKPFVTQTHGMICPDSRMAARCIDAVLTRRILAKAHTRFVLTAHEGLRLQAVTGRQRMRQTILGNGVPRSSPPLPHPRNAVPDVLFLARLQERKGVMKFAESARQLVRRGVEAKFSIVGPDWGELDKLRAFIAEHGLEQHVNYEGAVARHDAVARLARADVYVLPSVNEPYPMTVLEALAAGTPTVCTSDCGFADRLSSSAAAIVVEPKVTEITAAIERLLHDHALRIQISRGAVDVVERQFSIEAVTNALEETYEAALAGARH